MWVSDSKVSSQVALQIAADEDSLSMIFSDARNQVKVEDSNSSDLVQSVLRAK